MQTQYDVVIRWAGSNVTLLFTIALVFACATIDYKALPKIADKYVKPGGTMSQALNFGRLTISLLVGFYTLLALVFDFYGLETAAWLLVIWLLVDASFSIWVLFGKRK